MQHRSWTPTHSAERRVSEVTLGSADVDQPSTCGVFEHPSRHSNTLWGCSAEQYTTSSTHTMNPWRACHVAVLRLKGCRRLQRYHGGAGSFVLCTTRHGLVWRFDEIQQSLSTFDWYEPYEDGQTVVTSLSPAALTNQHDSLVHVFPVRLFCWWIPCSSSFGRL